MNKHLETIIEIAKLDQQIDDLEPKITAARKELDTKINEKEVAGRSIENIEEYISKLDSDIRESERAIAEYGKKVEEIAKKQNEIKTEKELKALNIEEDIAKENLTLANEQIAKKQAMQKAKKDEVAQLQGKIKDIEEEIKNLEKSSQKQIEEIKKQQEEISARKDTLAKDSDAKTMAFYRKVRKWAKNTSVVPVFKQACGGCFMKISDKIYSELSKQGDIVTCPHCGRILYYSDKQTYKECMA